MGKRGDRSCPLPTSRDYRALTAKQNCLEKASGPCGPRKIRARTKAREWRARACGDVPSRACAGRISLPHGRGRAVVSTQVPPPPPAYKTRGSLKSAYTRKAGSSGWEADQASRPFVSLEARSASGTTVGVNSHG